MRNSVSTSNVNLTAAVEKASNDFDEFFGDGHEGALDLAKIKLVACPICYKETKILSFRGVFCRSTI